MNRNILKFISILFVAGMASCATMQVPEPFDDQLNAADLSGSPSLVPGYLLNVSVVVAGKKEVDNEKERIAADGTIDLPFLGVVMASGKTIKELENHLRILYNESYFVNPRVSVDFVLGEDGDTYPWGYVTVMGRVKKPGRVRIPPTRDLTLMQAIQKVGGLDEFAKENSIQITRNNSDGDAKKFTMDLKQIPATAGREDLRLLHGDVIYVPEVIF